MTARQEAERIAFDIASLDVRHEGDDPRSYTVAEIGHIAKRIESAILAENEECAKVAEEYRNGNPIPTVYDAIAKAIRARSRRAGEPV